MQIPNLIGLLLGTTQLTVYVIYKKRPESTKGPTVGLVLGNEDMLKVMEMGAYDYKEAHFKDEAGKVVKKGLKRVKSLPKSVLNHEHNVRSILKTHSFGPNNNMPSTFWSTKPQQEDVDVEIGVDAKEDKVLNSHLTHTRTSHY